MAVDEGRQDLEHVLELLGRRVVRLVVAWLVLERREVRKTAHANHEPLVEVALEDRAELETLEQRHRFVEGLVEDAVVKAKPADLAILCVREVAILVFGTGPFHGGAVRLPDRFHLL